jgi:glycogen synthase
MTHSLPNLPVLRFTHGQSSAPPQRPRRILMTADTVGGVWTYAVELIRALALYDIEVTLATLGRPLNPQQQQEVAALPNLVVHESNFKLEWMADPWSDIAQASQWLLHLEELSRPDLIHLNHFAHGALPWRAPLLITGHSCVLSWWTAVKNEAAPSEWQRYASEVRRGLRAAQLVVAPTWTMLLALRRHYGPLPDVRVIANGRQPDLFPAQTKEPFVFACGRLWDEAKNVARLDQITPQLPWPVYIAGDQQPPQEQGQSRQFSHATCLGPIAPGELRRWFGRAAIYAMPARYEPFGLSILEAALAGCALLLGDIPSLREVWQDTAVYVPPDDPQAIRTALLELIKNDSRRHRLAQRAHERAVRLTPARMAEGYLAAYDRLLKQT